MSGLAAPKIASHLPNTLPPFRAIAFDMDGVLIHSTPCHRQAYEEILEQLGVTGFDYAQHAGHRTIDVMRLLLGHWPAGDVEAAAARKTARAIELIRAQRPVPADCRPTLQRLSRHWPLALASSASRVSIELFLEITGSSPYFSSVLSGSDVTRAKPDPELYARSAESLQVEPGSLLVVEDALAGIQAALAAGASVVAIAGTHPASELREAGAVAVVNSLSELAALTGEPEPQ